MAEFIPIKNYSNREEAELEKGLLEANGIKAFVTSDDCGTMDPALRWGSGGVALKVIKEDVEKAKEILDI
ncbi:MAG: DUF2007 domain-containing protein [bacterium]|nr:DUF2007 domain-containing protein [bacterium]